MLVGRGVSGSGLWLTVFSGRKCFRHLGDIYLGRSASIAGGSLKIARSRFVAMLVWVFLLFHIHWRPDLARHSRLLFLVPDIYRDLGEPSLGHRSVYAIRRSVSLRKASLDRPSDFQIYFALAIGVEAPCNSIGILHRRSSQAAINRDSLLVMMQVGGNFLVRCGCPCRDVSELAILYDLRVRKEAFEPTG